MTRAIIAYDGKKYIQITPAKFSSRFHHWIDCFFRCCRILFSAEVSIIYCLLHSLGGFGAWSTEFGPRKSRNHLFAQLCAGTIKWLIEWMKSHYNCILTFCWKVAWRRATCNNFSSVDFLPFLAHGWKTRQYSSIFRCIGWRFLHTKKHNFALICERVRALTIQRVWVTPRPQA